MLPRRSSSYRRIASPSRRGFTLVELAVVLIILAVLLVLLLPWLVGMRERTRRLSCETHLYSIGQAFANYRSTNPANAFPAGATYSARDGKSGTSWWLALLPYLDLAQAAKNWQNIPGGGDFGAEGENPNLRTSDGLWQPFFLCPSSPLPATNNPSLHFSAANRQALNDGARGILVPSYAAVAGGAPDAKDIDVAQFFSQPHGRNTADGKYGILSASGVMPVNQTIAEAAVRDPQSKTLLVVEQSDFGRNDALDPPDLYDLRSGWPNGLFMGSTGDYQNPSLNGRGVDGDDSARVWNVTTIRYPINTRAVFDKPGVMRPGYVFDPAPPRAPAPDQPPPAPPPYPPEGYGPGHNHGINSAHPGGAHVLMADGSARFFNESIELMILLIFATRDDGREVDDF